MLSILISLNSLMHLQKLEFRILSVWVNLQLSVDACAEHYLAHILYIHLKILLIDYYHHTYRSETVSPRISPHSPETKIISTENH